MAFRSFLGSGPRLKNLPGLGQCRGKTLMGHKTGVGELTGLPANGDGLIVATENA